MWKKRGWLHKHLGGLYLLGVKTCPIISKGVRCQCSNDQEKQQMSTPPPLPPLCSPRKHRPKLFEFPFSLPLTITVPFFFCFLRPFIVVLDLSDRKLTESLLKEVAWSYDDADKTSFHCVPFQLNPHTRPASFCRFLGRFFSVRERPQPFELEGNGIAFERDRLERLQH